MNKKWVREIREVALEKKRTLAKGNSVLVAAILFSGASYAQPSTNGIEARALAQIQAQRTDGLIAVQPWVQAMGPDTLGVGWLTSQAADGVVEWTQQENGGDAKWKKAWYSQDGLKQSNGTIQRAVVHVDDPATPIRLRAISRPIKKFGANRVDFGAATTSRVVTVSAPGRGTENISLLVFNDVHNNTQFYPLLTPLAGPNADLVVFNGDIMNSTADEESVINRVLHPMAWFASESLPCFFVRGNHETRGARARQLKDYLLLPDNRYYAAMTLGSARVLFLDSGEDKEDKHREYSGQTDFDTYMEEELAWLKREIESDAFRQAAWRIVIVHIPPHWRRMEAGKVPYGMKRMCDRFAPLFDEGNVDLVISGHTHKAEVVEPSPDAKRDWPIFIGGAHPLEKATVIRIDATPSTLKAIRYQSDGSVGAEWEKKK